MTVEALVNGSLKDASVNRLACLFRHWTWADEAMARFERELAQGWDYDEDPSADHLFGRLRRIHYVFGDEIRAEQMSRERLDLPDP